MLFDLAAIAGIAAVYFCTAKLGLRLAALHASATAVWPPTGIALAAVLLLRRRVWPGIWLGAFLTNVTTAGNLLTSMGIASGNTAEALIGAWLVTRFANGRQAFARTADIFMFILLAAILSTVVSATCGVTSLALGGFVRWDGYVPVWTTWWLGDSVSDLIIAPLILVWSSRPVPRATVGQRYEAAAMLLSSALVACVVFGGLGHPPFSRYPTAFLSIPVLAWAAFRFGQRGALASAFVLSSVALWGTLHRVGPFAVENRNDSLLLLQAFTAVITVTNLVLAAVVSERQHAEATLRHNQAMLKEQFSEIESLYKTAPIGLALLNTRLRFVRINKRLAAINGISVSDHIGRSLREVLPELADLLEPIHQRVIATGEPILGQEISGTTPAEPGVRRFWQASYYPLHAAGGEVLGVGVAVEDITERHRTEEALRESEARFRTMAESAPVQIWMSDTQKRFTYFNKRWLQFTGRTMEQERGDGWTEGVHPDDLQRCLEVHRASFDARREFQMEYRLRRHDGEYRWILGHGVPRFTSTREFSGYIGSCVDVTERRLAEQKMQMLNLELEERVNERTAELMVAHKRLQAEIDERRRLEAEIAQVSEREQLRLGQELHDGLGQRLAGLGFMIGALEEKLKHASPSRAEEAGRLQRLAAQCVEQTRNLAHGFYPVELERRGLRVALEDIAHQTERTFGISCVLQSEPSTPASFTGPRAIQLFRIAQEAVHNAVKHAQAKHIWLRLSCRHGCIRLTIQDDGRGLPSKLDPSKGMGLHIMQYRARLIGGKLDWRNDSAGGVVVTCSVPGGDEDAPSVGSGGNHNGHAAATETAEHVGIAGRG